MIPQKFFQYHWARWLLLATILFAIIYSCLNYVGSLQKKTVPVVTPPPIQSRSTITAVPTLSPGSVNLIGEGCKVSGCSGEICQNETDENMASVCIYQESYACYKTARCEKQKNGTCGWTQTKQLNSCVEKSDTANNLQREVCTQDAKMCPDGSSVGRTGPKCEFASCPN